MTVVEVEYGLRLDAVRGRQLRPVMDASLQDLQVLSYETEDARATAAIRAALRKSGQPIGPYDMLIAGTGMRHGLTVVTSNRREFERVSGLTVEDWRD